MATPKTLLTAEDLYSMPENGAGYELVNGELIEVTPPGWDHGVVVGNGAIIIGTFVKERGLGWLAAGDPGIVLRRAPDTVRGPDVAFISYERLPAGQSVPGYTEIVPDFVIEVVSPSDTAREVQAKTREWLDAGVRLVWLMYPENRSIVAWRGLERGHTYTETDTIDAEPVLPGFLSPVAAFFA
jgi:Uma2 family endonuclease